jgi:hypothetical protein
MSSAQLAPLRCSDKSVTTRVLPHFIPRFLHLFSFLNLLIRPLPFIYFPGCNSYTGRIFLRGEEIFLDESFQLRELELAAR